MPLINLTEEQLKVVNHLKGNLQIIACAGSGKTEVVSRRIANLVTTGVSPESIVAFTFTERAAEELKTRIREILDDICPDRPDIGEMFVGTIHSFCFEMLKELKPRYRGFDVLDDSRRFAFLSMPPRWYSSHLTSLQERGKFHTLSKFFKSCDIVKMEGIDVDYLSDEDFVEAYERYEESLERDRYLDFTSMIFRLVELLDSEESAKRDLNKKIKHLVVDEYQDINQIQERLIRHIANGCESLCVVGDDDQCIFNWRGSTVENILSFTENHGGATQIPLSYNFRSTGRIIDCAMDFIKHNSNRMVKQMRPRKDEVNTSHDDDLFYRHFNNDDKEASFIIHRIKSLVGTDFYDKRGNPFSMSYGDFAILTRKTWHAAKIAQRLEQAGIPFILDVGGEVFSRPEVTLGMKCLAYIFNISYDGQITLRSLTREYHRVFVAPMIENQPRYPKANLDVFAKEIKKLRDEVEAVQAKGRRDYLQMGLQPYFHSILKAFGARHFEFEPVYNYNLAILSQAIADYESVWRRLRASEVKYFFGFIGAYGRYSYVDQSHNDPSLIDAIKVLTIHRAKGLEFPVVFLPEFVKERRRRDEETFVDETLYATEKYVGTEEDERRVYYTALTRSMKYLFISSSSKRRKRDGEFYVRESVPHRFLREIINEQNFSDVIEIERPRSGHPKRAFHSYVIPTSFSDINTYRRCGHDYLLRNVYGYQAGVPPAFGYGARIHNILNIIYKEYISSRKIPKANEIEQLFHEHFFLRYATDAMLKNMEKGGINVVESYVQINQEDFQKVLETEKRFELVYEGALITGMIDLLKKMDEHGKVEEVEVVDFKTEKEMTHFYETDYTLQLQLYAIACIKALGLSPKKATIHHLDVRTGKGMKEEIDISQPALKKAYTEIGQTIDSIIQKEFPLKLTSSCQECDWVKICTFKKSAESGVVEAAVQQDRIISLTKEVTPAQSKPRQDFDLATSKPARSSKMDILTETATTNQAQFVAYVQELKEKGITGKEYRHKIMQWWREN